MAASSDARFREGDAVVVHGFGIGVDHDGGHAQYARVKADWAMPLPAGLSLREAATLGVAGYTAGLCLHWMEHNGLTPARGKVVVSGATGGVGSLAIDMLAGRGYAVTALTGKAAELDYLRTLGAAEVLPAEVAKATGKPLDPAQWAGAVDAVGGEVLAWMLRTLQPDGVATAFGNCRRRPVRRHRAALHPARREVDRHQCQQPDGAAPRGLGEDRRRLPAAPPRAWSTNEIAFQDIPDNHDPACWRARYAGALSSCGYWGLAS